MKAPDPSSREHAAAPIIPDRDQMEIFVEAPDGEITLKTLRRAVMS